MKIISWDVGIYNLAYCILEKKNDTSIDILHWDVININESNNVDIKHCTQKLNNNKSCKAKAKFHKNNTSYYCARHSKKINNLKQIKKPKKKKYNLLEVGTNLINKLTNFEFMLDVDLCIIENQPVLKNPRMKSIQMILYSYFLIHGLTQTSSSISDIKLCSARNKLKVYNGPPIEIICKNKYTKSKKLAIEHCKYFIKNDPQHINFFLNHKKKDDLADSYLQGLWYLNKL